MLAMFRSSTSTHQINHLQRASAQTHIRLSRNRSLGLLPISHHQIRTILTVFKGAAARVTLLRRSRSPYLHSISKLVIRLTFSQKRMERQTLLKIFYPHQWHLDRRAPEVQVHLLVQRIRDQHLHILILRQIRLRLLCRPCSIPMIRLMVR
jgi:hypothetical protein